MAKWSSRVLWGVFFVVLGGYLVVRFLGPGGTKNEMPAVEPVGSLAGLSGELARAFEAGDDFAAVPEPGPGDWLSHHDERGQTYDQYVHCFANRPDAARSKIYVRPLGRLSDTTRERLDLLLEYIELYFQIEAAAGERVRLEDIDMRTRINRYTGRRQLHAIDILNALKPGVPEDAFCVLAITGEDLYPEDSWNYAFGYASFRERVGVYSFARYDPAFFGEPRGEDFDQLFLKRSLRILAHEIAHMYSLRHCIYYHCVVNGSNNLAESDAQPLHLCPVCLRKLHTSAGFDVVQRYRGLGKFYRKAGIQTEADWIADRLEWIAGSDE